MAKTTLLAALAAVAATGASAQTMYMPNQANVTGINANPNATAMVPVAGWNMQKTFPGRWDADADPVKGGWTMHLNITANLTASHDFHNNQTRATRISLQLKPPAGLIDPQSGNWTVDSKVRDSWRMWIVQFGRSSIPPGGRNNNDGSCTGILSDDCIASLKAHLAAQRAVVQGNTTQAISGLASNCPFGGSAVYDVPLDSTFTLNTTMWSDDPIKDDRNYENAYDFYGSRPIPFAIIFGHGNSTELITGQPLEHDHVAVGCIKADTKVGESTMPSGGVASIEQRLSTVSLLSVVAVAGLLMLL